MDLANLPKAFALTIINHIATLLLTAAGGDLAAAQQAARETLASYDPRNQAEFQLAAQIISFSLQSIEALAQAANPDLSLTRVLRLRSGAVSLSRQAQKAQMQLEKLQKAQTPSVAPASVPEPVPPNAATTEAPQASQQEAPAVAPVEPKGKIAAYAQAHGLTFSQAMQQRNREMRLAERQAKLAGRAAAAKAA
jgi:hypothetical protein